MFTSKEIESGKINLDNSALMRILIKWCEELESSFGNIINRQLTFRMQTGEEVFLKKTDLIKLSIILQEEKK